MKINGRTSFRKQFALFAFALLYLVTVVTLFCRDNNFTRDNQSQRIPALAKKFQQKQQLVIIETISVNASGSGIVSEKEFLLLPLILLLRLLLFFRVKNSLISLNNYFNCRPIFLFRVFPNAP